jgi:hypothetical protein
MNESFFVQFKDWFKQIAKTVEERVNGKKTALTYMYKDMLTEELSADLKWNTLTINSNIVAADVVSLDSSLPLKKRDSFGAASGDVPKLGMKMQMTEKNMSDIDVLKARNAETSILVDKIFNDQVKCIMGVHEKLEFMFLQSLSSGVTVIDDDNNVGTGIRIDFGYKPANKFGATTVWSDVANATPIDDIKRVVKEAKASGDQPRFLMMDESTFDNLAANQQTREQFAFMQNFVGTQIPVPDLEQVNSMMQRRYRLTIVIVDRTVTIERDGVRTILTPWEANKIVLLESLNVGKLVYGILAEETRKTKTALYEKSGSFILLKKWSSDEPFAEFTSSQALAVPVIDSVSSIYTIDTEEATDSDDALQTEGDGFYFYNAVSYTLQSVVDGINAARAVDTTIAAATITQKDTTLAKKIDSLSEEGITLFEAELVTGP